MWNGRLCIAQYQRVAPHPREVRSAKEHPGVFTFSSQGLYCRLRMSYLDWNESKYDGRNDMLIRYADGSFVEGTIQRIDGGLLWVSVDGLDNTVEFVLVDREWVSESGSAVTFEFPVKVSTELFDIIVSDEEGKCAAGGDCVLRRMWTGSSPAN